MSFLSVFILIGHVHVSMPTCERHEITRYVRRQAAVVAMKAVKKGV